MQSKLSFNNLNTFATAAQTLSFQDAAEILHVTSSAVSHQVRNLESLLGYKLFDRLDKHICLTAEGERLYLDVREPLKQLHEASYKALRCSESNNLVLSVAPVFATRWLLPRLRNFHVQHPEINLSVIASTSLVDFRVDPFDAAIRMGDGKWPGTESKKLFDKHIVAVCNPHLIEDRGELFSADQLTHQPLIINASMHGLWDAWFESAGVKVTASPAGFEVESSAQALEAVASSDAIGLVDLNFISDDLKLGNLALACDHRLIGADGYFFTYPTTKSTSASIQSFAVWILSQVEKS